MHGLHKAKKFPSIQESKTLESSPLDNKYQINGENIKFKNLQPYMKKFKVRRLTKTEESVSKEKEQKDKEYSQSLGHNLQKLLKVAPNAQSQKSNKIYGTKLKNINRTIDATVRPPKIMRNTRIQTQNHTSLTSKYRSPYLSKHKLTIDTSLNKTKQFETFLSKEDKKDKYSFLTRFEMEEVQRHEVYFVGQRRIGNIKHFTDNSGNVKISIGDAIMYRYEIKGALGQGSFGQVFRAFDHKKGDDVALKIIKNHPKFNTQAKVEIKILQNVLIHDPKGHFNIIKLKHAFFFRGHACLVFELLHINLYEFLRINNFKGLQIDLIRRISIQILQSLLFFKKFDIVHCDLKPENILLKQENKTGIKIIDVGSGCYQSEQIYTYIQSRFYRAPEIILGMPYTSAIDIWSFGCILCELYIGYPIFPGQTQEDQMLLFMEVLGVPPEKLLDRGSRTRKFFEGYSPKIKSNSKGKIRNPGSKNLRAKLKGCEDEDFIQFIAKCFEWEPQKRFGPSEALLDKWILSGLPSEIRQQHIEIVKSDSSNFSEFR